MMIFSSVSPSLVMAEEILISDGQESTSEAEVLFDETDESMQPETAVAVEPAAEESVPVIEVSPTEDVFVDGAVENPVLPEEDSGIIVENLQDSVPISAEEPLETQEESVQIAPANVLTYENTEQNRVKDGTDPYLRVELTGNADFPSERYAWIEVLHNDELTWDIDSLNAALAVDNLTVGNTVLPLWIGVLDSAGNPVNDNISCTVRVFMSDVSFVNSLNSGVPTASDTPLDMNLRLLIWFALASVATLIYILKKKFRRNMFEE